MVGKYRLVIVPILAIVGISCTVAPAPVSATDAVEISNSIRSSVHTGGNSGGNGQDGEAGKDGSDGKDGESGSVSTGISVVTYTDGEHSKSVTSAAATSADGHLAVTIQEATVTSNITAPTSSTLLSELTELLTSLQIALSKYVQSVF